MKSRVLLEITLYVAMVAGIVVGTSGRSRVLALGIPLAIMGPFWILSIHRARRHRQAPEEASASMPGEERRPASARWR